tara:strand:- start:43 stop:1839 length:1797 start_codon:yes stop_codon:yes gene_type:complete
MTDKKITELNNLTGANLNDADEFVVVDISADETKAITAGQLKTVFLPLAGGTMTGSLNFGDNGQINLGASADFEMFHTGVLTRMEVNTGDLILRVLEDNKRFIIQSDNGAGGAATYITADGSSGEVDLSHYGSKKLATKATGVAITGSLTATGALIGHDSERTAANAALGAAMGLGKVFWMDGLPYINETGGTACTDLSVSNVSPVAPAKARHWDLKNDGVTDNTAAFNLIRGYCTATGSSVEFDRSGTYMTNAITINTGQLLSLRSAASLDVRPMIKLNAGANSGLINTANTARVRFVGINFDQDRDNQAGAGHILRSGGCSEFHVEQCNLYRGKGYGIGIQAGQTLGARIIDVYIEDTGSDAFDIKDPLGTNGTVYVRNLSAKNWSIDDDGDAMLDIRGPIDADGITGEMFGNCAGVRFRDVAGTELHRAGSGVVRNVRMIGQGVNAQTAVLMTSGEGNCLVEGVYGENVQNVFQSSGAAVGGIARDIRSRGTYGDGMSIGGVDLLVDGTDLQCTVAAPHCFDIEAAAKRNRMVNIKARNLNTSASNAGRIAAGAEDNLVTGDLTVSNATVGGGGTAIGDAGTNSVISGTRGFVAL